MSESYANSFSYQILMQRAFRSERNFKDIDNGPFLLLSYIKNGYAGKRSDYPKQVAKVKAYLAKAVAKILRWELTAAERSAVIIYAQKVEDAYNEEALHVAIRGLLDATQRFKEY